jgi:hemerythrin-like domain-containing protein
MPRHTEILRAEHAVVHQALQVLSAIAEQMEHGGELPVDDTATVLRFLRDYLVAMHFRKEGDQLWPALMMQSDDQAAAAIGDLMRLQDEVLELLHALVLFWEPAGDLTAEERQGFAATTRALAASVARMQQIEEQRLFTACDANIPLDDQMDWDAPFARLQSGRDHWPAAIRRLARTWLTA